MGPAFKAICYSGKYYSVFSLCILKISIFMNLSFFHILCSLTRSQASKLFTLDLLLLRKIPSFMGSIADKGEFESDFPKRQSSLVSVRERARMEEFHTDKRSELSLLTHPIFPLPSKHSSNRR